MPKADISADRLLTISETAQQLGVTYQRVMQILAAGELQRERIGHWVRIRESDVQRYVESRRVPASLPK
jgi:excisionase family DNA binding protein